MLEYRGPPVVYRGGCLLGMQLFVCVLSYYILNGLSFVVVRPRFDCEELG